MLPVSVHSLNQSDKSTSATVLTPELSSLLLAANPGRRPTCSLLDGVRTTTAKCALPDRQVSPAGSFQFLADRLITLGVSPQFRLPERTPRAWQAEQVAVMLMPEATVDKDNSGMARKGEIGTAGQPARVQTEA